MNTWNVRLWNRKGVNLVKSAGDRFSDLVRADPSGTEMRSKEAENALSLETEWPYLCGLELKTLT